MNPYQNITSNPAMTASDPQQQLQQLMQMGQMMQQPHGMIQPGYVQLPEGEEPEEEDINLVQTLKPDLKKDIEYKLEKKLEKDEEVYSSLEDKIKYVLHLSGLKYPDDSDSRSSSSLGNEYIKNSGTNDLFSSALAETALSIATSVSSYLFNSSTEMVSVELVGSYDPSVNPQMTPQHAEAMKKRIQKNFKAYFSKIFPRMKNELEQTIIWSTLIGPSYRKGYFDPKRGIPRTTFINPTLMRVSDNFDIFYGDREYTHIYYLTEEELKERVKFHNWDEGILSTESADEKDGLDSSLKEISGKSSARKDTSNPDDKRYAICERYMDLAGIEGSEDRPYIVTFGKNGKLAKITPNYMKNDPLYLPQVWFAEYQFLCGFSDGLSLANVAGQNARAASVLERRTIDGCMAAAFPPGFMKPNAKMGDTNFDLEPGKIKTLPTGDDDISNAITFAPTSSPPPLMVQLKAELEASIKRMSLLVSDQAMDLATRAPQGSVLSMLQRMEALPNAIIGGLVNSFAQELNLLKRMFYDWLEPNQPLQMEVEGEILVFYKEDYAPSVQVKPYCLEDMESDAYKLMRGEIVLNHATQLAQFHNMPGVLTNFYKDLGLSDKQIQEILAPPPQQPAPEVQIANLILQHAAQLPAVHNMHNVMALFYQANQVPADVIQQVLVQPEQPGNAPIDPSLVGMAEIEAQKEIAQLEAHVKMLQIESNNEIAQVKAEIEAMKVKLKEEEQEHTYIKEEFELALKEKDMELKALESVIKQRDVELEHFKSMMDIVQKEKESAESMHFQPDKSMKI